MNVLFSGLGLFGAAFVIHFILWKIRLPKRQTRAILAIFLGTLLAGTAFIYFVSERPWQAPGYIRAALLFVSLMLAYIITYSAIEADSPSLVMVLKIAGAAKGGLPGEELRSSMTDEVLIKPRVRDLLLDKMARFDGQRYSLTPKGVLFARIFILYRRLLRAPKGG